jgi:cyclase
MIVAVDAKQIEGKWYVHTHGGRKNVGLDLYEWAKQAEELGAGEILFTSMDHDGTKAGFAIEALSHLNKILTIPVIASGGAGTKEHFLDALVDSVADAALAASVFHYKQIEILDLKKYLHENKINVRL